MRGRRFEESDAMQLCQALAGNTVLRELSTGSHAVSSAAAAAFAEALAANTVLESLDVGNSSFGDEGLAALARGIAASTSLRTLNLERKGISAAGCAALAAALAGSGGSALAELLIGQNGLGPEGLAALLSGSSLAGLQQLDLSACGLEGAAGLEPLAAALQEGRLPALTSLRLDGNALGASGAATLAAGLGSAAAGELNALHLQRCGLDGEAVGALSEALPAQLACLDVSGNGGMGAEGAAALARALAEGRPPRLCRLLLCGCGLDDSAIAVLADALARRGVAPAAELGAAGAACTAGGADEGLALDLSGNTAGAAALAALAALPLASLCLHDGEDVGSGADGELPCPRLRLLVIAANPGDSLRPGNTSGGRPHLPVLLCSTNGQVSEAIERLQESRPGLDVVRRAADTGEGGLMR